MRCRFGPSTSTMAVLILFAACEQPSEPVDAWRSGISVALHPGHGWGPAVSVDPGGSANLNTASLEGCPIEGPDGLSLYFASNRDGQIDLWVSRRPNPSRAWGAPEKLPEPVNSAFNDFCPTPLPGGGLLFVSTRPGGCGAGTADIYQTRLHPTQGWLEPEHLGCDVNSAGNEFSPSYVSAGGGLLFFSSDRASQDDIYMSARGPGGDWGPAAPVEALNFAGFNTARPNVSPDGREIVFDSNRPGGFGGPDIWTATRPSVFDVWSSPVNLGPNINTEFGETRASLSRNGKRLYFGSNRPGFQGHFDIFVSTRR
jgi:Tol biopolymer transport system component